MIFFTQVIHRHALKHARYALKSVVQLSLNIILILYLFIQLNFDLVSHNFGTKTDQFVDSYQLLLVLLTTTALVWGYKFITLVMTRGWGKVSLFLNTKSLLIRVIFTTILLISTGLSFSDLFNNFSWSVVGTNLINLPNFSAYYATVSTLALILLLYKPSLPVSISSGLLTTITYTLPYMLLIKAPRS